MRKWKILSGYDSRDILGTILKNRGIVGKSNIESYLNPKLSNITLSSVGISSRQMSRAVKRIKQAIEGNETIIVYADYDVDGLCAGAIVWEQLHALGAKVFPYVPHRLEEGYGLSEKGLTNILRDYPSTKLIITVDHGISALEKVQRAKALGLDVIITDHHSLPDKLPEAVAIVHTTQLSGSGVAWLLALSLAGDSQMHAYLDLVTLATIADLLPLTGHNRTLVTHGLKELNRTDRPGLKALINESGLSYGDIGVYEVGHVISPRINAVGRLAHALEALRLLCTKNAIRAQRLAHKLSLANRERQELTAKALLHAKSTLGSHLGVSESKLLFLHDADYNQGIIGLVAGKLVEEYYRPTIVISRGEVVSKASARSISGFNIVAAIRSLGDLLIDCGGHPLAAGFTVETRNLLVLEKRLVEIAERELNQDNLTRILNIDCELKLDQIDRDLYLQIKRCEPYGFGNAEPTFATFGTVILDSRVVGREGKHLKLKIGTEETIVLEAIAFGMGDLYPKVQRGLQVDITYAIGVNTWNGKKNLQLKIKDIRLANTVKN